MGKGLVLFGVRTPLIVEYEETLARSEIDLVAGVSLGGPSRLMERSKLILVDQLKPELLDAKFLPCAFAPHARARLFEHGLERGFVLSEAVVDPTAIVARSSRIGAGGFVNSAAVIGAASRLDELVFVNRSASIGHHCLIGRLASIGPGAVLASNVRVGKSAVVGAGAVVLPDVHIGDGAVISAGSVVRRSVPEGVVVSGNPARPTRLKPERTLIGRGEQE